MQRTILFVTKSRRSSATRYRAELLFPQLKSAGWQVVHVSSDQSWFRLRLLLAARRAGITFIQRRLLQGPTWALLRLLCPRIVFDFDDAIFLKSSGTPSATREARFARIASACTLILAGNEYLAGRARQHCGRVEVVPTAIRIADYPPPGAVEPSGPALVWIGSRSTAKYLHEFRETFAVLHGRLPDLRLKIIADFDWPDCPLPCEAIPWSKDIEVSALQSAQIGIAPMPDNPWTRGKCALKVLQYMAAGLPVVSSSSGANAEVIRDGETGLLASTPEEWCQAIERLLRDAALREQMGRAGRARAEAEFSQEALVPRVVNLLQSL